MLNIIAIFLLSLLPSDALGETVSGKEAARIAETFFNAAYGQIMAKPKLVFNGKRFTTNKLFTPFYVYNHPFGGFVIISAENKAMPILGFSLKSSFSPDNLSLERLQLLSEYAREIEYIRYDSRLAVDAIEAWNDIKQSIDDALNRYTRDDNLMRIEEDSDGSIWIMRKSATEFPEIIRVPELNEPQEAEYTPFEFYDNFISQVTAEKQKRLESFDSALTLLEPKLHWIGGGHFEVQIPGEISILRLYNIEGALIRMLTFKNTDTALFNLDNQPTGFYIVSVTDSEGRNYSFKIYK